MKTWEDIFGKIESNNINEAFDEQDNMSLEDLLREYEVFNPKEFINYLNENGYKIIKK